MAYLPIAQTVPQYSNNGNPASGYVLKFYAAGTSTVIDSATDNTGGTLVSDIVLNAEGYPDLSGSIFIPHVDQSYKLALYPTQSAADSNTGAVWSVDNLAPAVNADTNSQVQVSSNDSTPGYLNGKLTVGTGIRATEVNDGSDESLNIDPIMKTYDTLALMVADVANISIGDKIYITERTSGNGGGAWWSAVDATTVTTNTYDIVAGNATVAFYLSDFQSPSVTPIANVKQFGAVGNGTVAGGGNDDFGAIDRAYKRVVSNGRIHYPDGSYRVTQPLVPAIDEAVGLYLSGDSQMGSVIIADHNLGAAVKLNRSNTGISDLTIQGSTARKSGAAGTNYGVHLEGKDVGNKACANVTMQRVRILDHPSHGLMGVGNLQLSNFENVQCNNNGGHGFWFHEGTATGRVNIETPGIVTLTNCWSILNGGHALCLGDPSDTVAEGCYRFKIDNFEGGDCATNAAFINSTDQNWGRGTAITITGTATGGAVGATGGWRCMGKNWHFNNNRFVSRTACITIDADPVRLVSEGFNINGLSVVNTTVNPAVIVTTPSSTSYVHVKSYSRDRITSLLTPGVPRSTSSLLGPDIVTLIKTTTSSAISTTTYTDDSEITAYFQADEIVSFKLKLRYAGDPAADLKIKFSVPAGITVRWGPSSAVSVDNTDSIVVTNEKTESGELPLGVSSSSRWTEIVGYISTGSTSGNFTLQYAQVVSSATPTQILPGTSLEINRRNQI